MGAMKFRLHNAWAIGQNFGLSKPVHVVPTIFSKRLIFVRVFREIFGLERPHQWRH